VKNKVLLISLAVVLVLGIGLVGCGGGGETPPVGKIVLGMSRSETGDLKDIHFLAFYPVYTTYAAMVNARPGKLTVGATAYTVDLYVLNDDSKMDRMKANTNTIIGKIKAGVVHFLFGPTCTAFLEAQAYIANADNIVQMTAEGGATSLVKDLDTLPYTFVNLSFSNWYQMPVLATMLKEAHTGNYGGGSVPQAYIAYIDDAHGYEYRDESEAAFQAVGINVCKKVPILASTVFTDLTTDAKTAGPGGTPCHIFCGFTYPANGTFALAQAANATGYDADAFILGPGACFGVYPIVIAGSLADGVVSFGVANNKTVVKVGTPSMNMTHFFNSVMGGFSPNTDFWGGPCYWAAMEMWESCTKSVGVDTAGTFSIVQSTYRDALADGTFITIFGTTKYVMFDYNALTPDVPDQMYGKAASGGGMMDYKCHTGEIIQWQPTYAAGLYAEVVGNSTQETDGVLPNYDVTASFIYPKPDWHG
jgi:ABC-type branched-subunit amino acid transport system substrate-binding protein